MIDNWCSNLRVVHDVIKMLPLAVKLNTALENTPYTGAEVSSRPAIWHLSCLKRPALQQFNHSRSPPKKWLSGKKWRWTIAFLCLLTNSANFFIGWTVGVCICCISQNVSFRVVDRAAWYAQPMSVYAVVSSWIFHSLIIFYVIVVLRNV